MWLRRRRGWRGWEGLAGREVGMCTTLWSECGGKVPGMRPEGRMMLEKSA